MVWKPASDAQTNTRRGRFRTRAAARSGLELTDNASAWKWSVGEVEAH